MERNYEKTPEELLRESGVTAESGLSQETAEARLAEYGRNVFEAHKRQKLIYKILAQFKDVSVIILLIAGVLSLVMSIVEGGSFVEPIVVFAVIVMNIVLAVTQERSAENALEALKSLSSPICRVLRGGEVRELDPALLVPGDIIMLKTGDLVPADARLITCESLAVDESSLTGESVPAEKDAFAVLSGDVPLGDRVNVVFSGCLVTAGTAVAIVTGTGMNTQIGRIAQFLKDTKQQKTPLQTRLDKVGKVISGVAVMSAIAMLVVGLVQGHGIWEMALVAVTLAVAAVPETLSLIVTLILTQGAKKMAAKNALVRQMQAVETLGSTSVICSDKTGTLTMNKMTVKRLWAYGSDPVAEDAEFGEAQMSFLEKLSLACAATVGTDDDGNEKIFGDPTETAIVRLAKEKGIDYEHLGEKYKKAGEIPFSSSRKMMTNVVELPEGGWLVLTKGAFDRLPFRRDDYNYMRTLEQTHDAFASDALRVIALASRRVDKLPKDLTELERDLTFEGFVGIIDPPRPEAAAAIAKAKVAGIRTIMITGDHAATAAAIARELGIITANEGVITGTELAKLSDDELADSIEFYSVYARVSPEDKIRIVKAWQARGDVVAMTGDGVNDAPALKAADVGVAMGVNGTEVAKSAAKMILTDDKFSTIIEAVAEGRNIFSNIRKLVYFLLVCNISEIIVMLFAQFMNWDLPLTPLMLLIINVLGDGIPGMALAKEESDKRIMKRRPIARTESFFGGGLMEVIIRQTCVFAIVSLAAFYIGMHVDFGNGTSVETGRTMAFLVTGWTSILHVLTVRSRSNMYKYRVKDNPQLYISCAAMLAVFAFLAAVPPVANALGLGTLGGLQWLVVVGLTLAPTIIAEYGKFWDAIKSRTAEKNRVGTYR